RRARCSEVRRSRSRVTSSSRSHIVLTPPRTLRLATYSSTLYSRSSSARASTWPIAAILTRRLHGPLRSSSRQPRERPADAGHDLVDLRLLDHQRRQEAQGVAAARRRDDPGLEE